jgi:imidazoleglycerol phosphate synthase cyclase subunit
MLYPRIIPSLLVKNKGLVKTVKFDNPKYVGDPINAVRIFNEKTVDELIVLDIDATTNNREPDYKMIANLAAECRMPLCYGGGIKTTKQALKIFGLGVEKIALSSAVINNPKLITEVARSVGNQSVIVVLDVKKKRFSSKYELYTHNGTKKTGINPVEFAKKVEQLGCGEIVINSILDKVKEADKNIKDSDIRQRFYDFEFTSKNEHITRKELIKYLKYIPKRDKSKHKEKIFCGPVKDFEEKDINFDNFSKLEAIGVLSTRFLESEIIMFKRKQHEKNINNF